MTRFCTVPIDLEIDKDGNPQYVCCGKPAITVSKVDKDWCFCEAHTNTAVEIEKWEVEPLKEKEINYDNTDGSRC